MILSSEKQTIAELMLKYRGNLVSVSRDAQCHYNAMALRRFVKDNPEIRTAYQGLLAEELQDKGIHITERILKMAELQEEAFGKTIIGEDGKPIDMPADPKMAIELSKEISRLIAEGKGQSMSTKHTLVLSSKKDIKEILDGFLDS